MLDTMAQPVGFSLTSGFHRFLATKPVCSETSKQYGGESTVISQPAVRSSACIRQPVEQLADLKPVTRGLRKGSRNQETQFSSGAWRSSNSSTYRVTHDLGWTVRAWAMLFLFD